MLFKVVVVLAVAGAACGFPAFFSSLLRDEEDGELTEIVEYLAGFGKELFTAPNPESGTAVSNWSPASLLNPEELGLYPEGDLLIKASKTRNGLRATSARWPKGKIPYTFGASFNAKDRATIDSAMAAFHEQTCVRFVPRTTEPDYVVITSQNTGCWSSVGRVGGAQELNLQSPGCLVQRGTVMHEMMHTLGFLHEQNRWERDDFVTVNYANIQPGRENNFVKAEKAQTDALGIKYDYSSVMHYSANAFSVNGQPTIVPKQPNAQLGQRDKASHQDIQKIRRMYKCKKH